MDIEILFPEIALFASQSKQVPKQIDSLRISRSRRRRPKKKIRSRLVKEEDKAAGVMKVAPPLSLRPVDAPTLPTMNHLVEIKGVNFGDSTKKMDALLVADCSLKKIEHQNMISKAKRRCLKKREYEVVGKRRLLPVSISPPSDTPLTCDDAISKESLDGSFPGSPSKQIKIVDAPLAVEMKQPVADREITLGRTYSFSVDGHRYNFRPRLR